MCSANVGVSSRVCKYVCQCRRRRVSVKQMQAIKSQQREMPKGGSESQEERVLLICICAISGAMAANVTHPHTRTDVVKLRKQFLGASVKILS